MPPVRLLLFCLAVFCASNLGCSSVREIETTPPQPAVPAPAQPAEVEGRAMLSVVVETGASMLPEDVATLAFRLAEIHLKPAGDTTWTAYPADANRIEIRRGERVRKTVLLTQVPPATYDSLALTLSDIFVHFDANTGAPLTMPRGTPLRLAFPLQTLLGRQTTLRLVFEPGASLSRTPACHWLFLPFFTAEITPL